MFVIFDIFLQQLIIYSQLCIYLFLSFHAYYTIAANMIMSWGEKFRCDTIGRVLSFTVYWFTTSLWAAWGLQLQTAGVHQWQHTNTPMLYRDMLFESKHQSTKGLIWTERRSTDLGSKMSILFDTIFWTFSFTLYPVDSHSISCCFSHQ